jgi:hypothetical protein
MLSHRSLYFSENKQALALVDTRVSHTDNILDNIRRYNDYKMS